MERMRRALVMVGGMMVVAGCYSSFPFTVGVDAESDADGDAAAEVVEDPAAEDVIEEWTTDVVPDGGETCSPPADYIITVSFFLDAFAHDEEHDIELVCDPPVITTGDGSIFHELDCEDGRHLLEIDTRPSVRAAMAEITRDVTLRYVSRNLGEGWSFKWFTMRDDAGDLIMAGVQSNTIAPPGYDPAEWYAPLWVGYVSGVCPIENPGCYTTERLALDIVCGGARERFFEDSRGSMGSIDECYVQVGESFRTHRISCSGLELPSEYFAVLIVR
ncbi:MAG: hypothetical protein JRG91_18415 [Deltaproteobacteria bacterium]|nr:hypothetical protein [Deltaproteobacteria bacterium]